MCGRCTLSLDIATLKSLISRRYEVTQFHLDDYSPSYNIAPSQSLLAVISDGYSHRIGRLRWGLIPHWAKDDRIGYQLINARSESLLTKPTFSHLIKQRRCILLIDGFYEWSTSTKTPYRIYSTKESLLSLAGLWTSWKNKEGESIYTCTIITTTANSMMQPIHHRMPVILTKEQEKKWLDTTIQEPSFLQSLLQPYHGQELTKYKVSPYVNHWKNNDIKCIQRV